MQENAVFALVLAWVAAPNGQEWYQDRFGVRGRMGTPWAVWSTGGRMVTLALIFLFMSMDITGWRNLSPDIQFGLGFHPDSFTIAAADFLDHHNEITGNILNTSTHQGDLLIWKSAPKRKTYVDGRARLFPRELQEQWNRTRKALSEDDVAGWKALLDKYDISTIMIEPNDSPITYGRLMQSPNWVPFYDDGRIVMFGRADAPATDLAFFKANQLDADLRAYRTTHPIAGAERPPNPTTWIDGVFQNRTFSRPQSRVDAAQRWLRSAPRIRAGQRTSTALDSGPGAVHSGDPGSANGAREQPGRLAVVPNAEGSLPVPDAPGECHAVWRSDHARERGADSQARPEGRDAHDPNAAAHGGAQLCDPNDAASEDRGGTRRSGRAEPRARAALFPARRVIWVVTVSKRFSTALSPMIIPRR